MDERLWAFLREPTCSVPTAGRALGLKGKNAAYKARKDGDIPSIRVGGQYRVPTAKLREMLGLPPIASEPQTTA